MGARFDEWLAAAKRSTEEITLVQVEKASAKIRKRATAAANAQTAEQDKRSRASDEGAIGRLTPPPAEVQGLRRPTARSAS